jgi:hypothetical protein
MTVTPAKRIPAMVSHPTRHGSGAHSTDGSVTSTEKCGFLSDDDTGKRD